MNRRRVLLAIVSVGLGFPAARESSAQSTAKAAVLGLLDGGERLEWWATFQQALRDLGYVEAQSLTFHQRFARGRFEQLPALAQELVRLKVAVIVTSGTVAAQAAKHATSAIPIVMATGTEETASLARPGANVTGLTSLSTGLTGKRFELVREVVPQISRLAVLWHRGGSELALTELKAAARPSKVALQVLGVTTEDELPGAFSAMTKERARAVFVIADPMLFSARQRISDLAIKLRLPSIHGPSEYVEAGGLLSYGPSYPDLFRRAAVYVDKILKGARPGDLPIEQPAKFELVVNLKTAQALRVTIPRAILLRADRLIE